MSFWDHYDVYRIERPCVMKGKYVIGFEDCIDRSAAAQCFIAVIWWVQLILSLRRWEFNYLFGRNLNPGSSWIAR